MPIFPPRKPSAPLQYNGGILWRNKMLWSKHFCPLFPFVFGERFGQGVAFPGQPFRTSARTLLFKYFAHSKFLFKLFFSKIRGNGSKNNNNNNNWKDPRTQCKNLFTCYVVMYPRLSPSTMLRTITWSMIKLFKLVLVLGGLMTTERKGSTCLNAISYRSYCGPERFTSHGPQILGSNLL